MQCLSAIGTQAQHIHTPGQTGNHPELGYVAFILKALFADSGEQADGVFTWILTILQFEPHPPQIFIFKNTQIWPKVYFYLCGFSSKALAKLNSIECDVVSTRQESNLGMSNFWEYPHSFERMKE